MHPIEFFERTYIVNLRERADRRREMDEQLAMAGLVADGNRIRYFPAVRPDDAGDFPSIGARGCFMSHLQILEEAARDGLGNVLVLEDDLDFDARLHAASDAFMHPITEGGWDFAYFGHVADDATSMLQQMPFLATTDQPLATTHFYAMNGRAISLLKDHLNACLNRPVGHPLGSPMHVDGAYSLYRSQHPELLTLMAVPSLGGQRSSRSDIFPNKWYDRNGVTRLLAGFARRLKNRFTPGHLHS
jgi:glycosyl transferase, family 25